MTAIVDYDTLKDSIGEFTERVYSDAEKDRFIGLAEGEFRLYLGPNFAKVTTAPALAFTAGSATLPAGFVRSLALTHATYGALTEKSIGEVRQRRLNDSGGIPSIYAIIGATIEAAPAFTGAAMFDYEGTLAGLSDSNPTNFVILDAPQAYLSMCLAYEKAFNEDWNATAVLKGNALQILAALSMQAVVAEHGRAAVSIPGSTP